MSKKLSFLNFKGIITLVIVLAVFDLLAAYVASPLATRVVQESINRATPAKIFIGSARFHPLLLSIGITDFEVFDPEDSSKRVFRAGHAGVWIDPVSVLRKRVDIGRASFKNVELAVVRDASGKVNIEKFSFGKKEAKNLWETAKQAYEVKTSDWFEKSYKIVKDALKKKKAMGEAKKEYKATVTALEKGRLVEFETADQSIFKVGHFELSGGVVALEDNGQQLPTIRDISLDMTGFRVMRSGGAAFNSLDIKGKVASEPRSSTFSIKLSDGGENFNSEVNTRDLDLAAFRPLYENSLPVSFNRGYLTIDSKSRVALEKLTSDNHIRLEEHELVSRKQFGLFGGAPDAAIAALNRRPSLDIRFQIGGTADKPSFDGFEKELMKIVGDELKQGLVSGLKEDPKKAIGEWSDKLKGVFNV